MLLTHGAWAIKANPAIIHIAVNLYFCFYVVCEYKFNVECYSIVLCNKSRSFFLFLFHNCYESQSTSLPNSGSSGIRLSWWLHWQSINLPGGSVGLNSAATSRSLGNWGYLGSRYSSAVNNVVTEATLLTVCCCCYPGLPLLGFVLCLFALYSAMPVVMGVTSAASINLNLLSADFYALLFGIFLFKYQVRVS